MDHPAGPKVRYLESLMLISLLEVCQEPLSLMGVLGVCGGFLTGDFEDRVILAIMNVLGRPPQSYTDIFCVIISSFG